MASAYAKFTGETRRVPGDRRPRRDSPDHRPVRRQARPHAGARDHRPGSRATASAPTTSRSSIWTEPVHGRCRRLRPAGPDAAAGRRHFSTARSASPSRANGGHGDRSCRTTSRTASTRSRRARTATACSSVGLRAAEGGALREQDLRRAAEVLNAGKKVAILVGAGALHATDEVIAVADRLQAGAAKALLGKAALPDDLPWVTGSIGLLGTKPSSDMMDGLRHAADDRLRLPVVGVPAEGRAGPRRCRSTSTRRCSSIRYPMEVNLHGDSAETLRALLPLLRAESRHAPGASGIAKAMARLVEDAGRPRHARRPTRSTRSASPGSCRRACRTGRSSRRDSGVLRQLVRPRPQDAARHDVLALGRPRLDGRGRALRDRAPSSPIPTGRSSPWSATAPCR